jgi:hypothetical protein
LLLKRLSITPPALGIPETLKGCLKEVVLQDQVTSLQLLLVRVNVKGPVLAWVGALEVIIGDASLSWNLNLRYLLDSSHFRLVRS